MLRSVVTRVLALDVGTSSVRARLYDEGGEPVEGVEAQTRYDVSPSGVLDPQLLLRAAEAAVENVSGAHGVRVDAIACSCFWHSLLPLDGRGRPLAPLLTWRDVRSAPQAHALAEALDGEAVWARTGAPLHASFWPAKLAWLAAEEPEAFSSARHFVGFGDWLLQRQTGELRASLSTASATGLWAEAGWDEELLAAIGVEPERLPPVSDDPCGSESAPWFPALGDGACSNLGIGCLTPDRAALMIGTSGALRIVAEDASPPPPGLFRYRLDARRAVVGGAVSDGGNLYAWLEQTLRPTETRGVAERAPAGHCLTFIPSLGGERSPTWDDEARGVVAGLTFETTALDLVQAGLEAVAYAFAAIAERLPGVPEIVATGRALYEDTDWLQILADVLERPVERSTEPEASARGAAVFALERLGFDPSPPARGRLVEPRPERFPAHREARERLAELRYRTGSRQVS